MKQVALKPQAVVSSLRCDRCGLVADIDALDCEFHEFTSVDYKAGYGSIFGDGNKVEIDLCQHCVKTLLGTWLRTTEPSTDFDTESPEGQQPVLGILPEHTAVVVTTALPHLGLEPGANGVIVHVLRAGEAYEVELFDQAGRTVGVETVSALWVCANIP